MKIRQKLFSISQIFELDTLVD